VGEARGGLVGDYGEILGFVVGIHDFIDAAFILVGRVLVFGMVCLVGRPVLWCGCGIEGWRWRHCHVEIFNF
jgi:hypothetical protein